MNRQSIETATREEWLALRAKDVTSTECGALFKLSPYMTPFELWHRKKNQSVVSIDENERMRWGTRLQSAIAMGFAHDRGLVVKEMTSYMRIPDLRLGSSFDFAVIAPSGPSAILEIKNVDSLQYQNGWIDDGDNSEAPPHIEIQVQHQMLVSGINTAFIVALVGGNKLVTIERKADAELHEEILKRAAEFWKTIDEGKEPYPEFPQDSEAVINLYNYASPNTAIAASPDIADLAKRYQELGWLIKPLEAERTEVKARILKEIGAAEKCVGDNFTISAGVVGPARIEYDREGYRTFKINWRKKK